jgi:hypothetical protein
MAAIKDFSAKVKKANLIGSNEIRLSTKEAIDLVTDINAVLADLAELSRKLQATEKLLGAEIIMDGGEFE